MGVKKAKEYVPAGEVKNMNSILRANKIGGSGEING